MEAAQATYDGGAAVLESLNVQYDYIISWADMYDTASMEAKRIIVNCLIKRVESIGTISCTLFLILILNSSVLDWILPQSPHKTKTVSAQ